MRQWWLRVILSWFFFGAVALAAAGCSRQNSKLADSAYNRQAFIRCFGFAPGAGVSGIYYFADEFLGFDPAYYMAFNAPPEVIEKIIAKYALKAEAEAEAGFPGPIGLVWWNEAERLKSRFFQAKDEKKRTAWMLWYDESSRKCQFLLYFW